MRKKKKSCLTRKVEHDFFETILSEIGRYFFIDLTVKKILEARFPEVVRVAPAVGAEAEPGLVRAAAAEAELGLVPAAVEVELAVVSVALEVLPRRLVVLRSERLWVVRQGILEAHLF